jgi:asparagine synthase (glutamine-hydrolysing)
MCGIAGILNFNDQPNEPSLIRKMTGAMAHRGPDAVGFFTAGGMDLGHLRLSIIDLSSAANQPFADNTGRYTIVFNGEMYNYQHVRSLMPEYAFRTNSDTEVLIAAYAKWGAGCLDHFRGMFAFAIWDRQEKELFLARDRMGVKPLYYYIDGERLVFASEVRGILATGLVAGKLSRQGLVEYFSYQSVSYPFSMIDGIRQVEAASWMRIKNGQVDKGIYWDLTRSVPDADFSDKQRTERRIRELMLQSIERRLVSDVPVGAFLSGGIDSSIVVGLMAEAGSSRPNTFNIAFEEKEFDESPFAEIIARKFDTNHTRILLKPTVFLDELQNALNAMDSPSGDGINSYVVSKAIRQKGMTVALSGAGGDELFAGYPFFAQFLQLQSKAALWRTPALFRRFLAGAWAAGKREGKRGKIAQLLELSSVDIDQVYPVFRQILSPRLLGQLTDLSGPVSDTAIARELRSKRREI